LIENEIFDDTTVSHELEILLKKGIAAAQKGDRVLARELLTKVADADPQCENAWVWLASISDYPEELLSFLNRVLAINPENGRALEWHAATKSLLAKTFVQRAIAAREEGSLDLAAECLDAALAHDNDCEAAWSWKASMAADEDLKLACLERVLEINPHNADAAEAIAGIKRSRSGAAFAEAKVAAVAGKRMQALDLVDEFLRSVPDNAEAWILRSHLSIELDEKIASLEKALAIDPDNAAARSGYDFLKATFSAAAEEPVPAEVPVAAAPESEGVPFLPDVTESSAEPEPVFVSEAEYDDVDAQPAMLPAIEEISEQVEIEAPAAEPVSPFTEFASNNHKPVIEEPAEEAAEEYEIVYNTADFIQPEPVVDAVEEAPVEMPAQEIVAKPAVPGFACPFCKSENEAMAFDCNQCHAVLTLADIESLLSNPNADREAIQNAVSQMEAEWNLREFSEAELTALAIGHFNLRNFTPGYSFLEEASKLNPNNVILSGQLNAIAIRLDEIRRQAEAHESQPKGRTILVVDDSATVRKLISGKLEKSGHHVVCANDGIEALECLEVGLPDLVLLDITMPRMDGYEVCKQIRANPAARDLPVVMISGKDGFFDKVRGRMAGTTGYVTKPFGPETLMKALETYLLPDDGAEPSAIEE
jgi:twitching motility two-component system response regulator PilG